MTDRTPGSTTYSPPARIRSLDGLRGCAIVMVLIFHLYIQTPVNSSSLHVFFRTLFGLAGAGVDLFFVLSGFLIGGILLEKSGRNHFARDFYLRRFFRIVPIYLLLLLTLLLARRMEVFSGGLRELYFGGHVPLWSYFVFLQNNLMASLRDLGSWWLVPTWSLAVEEQFYLITPWVVRLLSRRRLLILCVCSLFICPLVRWVFLQEAQNPFGAIYLLIARSDTLLAGVLLAVLVRDERFVAWRTRHPDFIGVGAILSGITYLGISLTLHLGHVWALTLLPSFWAIGFGFVLLYLVTSPASRLSTWLSRPAWVFMGGISYFVYLFHLPVQYTLHAWFFSSPLINTSVAQAGVTLLGLVLTLPIAWLSRRCFEQPLIRLSHRLTDGAT